MKGDVGVSSGSGPYAMQVQDLKFFEFVILRQGSLQTDGQRAYSGCITGLLLISHFPGFLNGPGSHESLLQAASQDGAKEPVLCHCLQGSVLTPGMDHPISLQPASMMGPVTQQLGHLSLSTTGTVKQDTSEYKLLPRKEYLCTTFQHKYLNMIRITSGSLRAHSEQEINYKDNP